PSFTMVGLPDTTVRESRDRVRLAIRNSGLEFPPHRITVNLAPADVRKAGSSFDLPIALGVLATTGQLAPAALDDTLVLGELSLDGGINAIRGVLPIAVAARRRQDNAREKARWHPAATHLRGSARVHRDPFRRRHALSWDRSAQVEAVPCSASYRLERRAGRWWRDSPPRRNLACAQRRAVP